MPCLDLFLSLFASLLTLVLCTLHDLLRVFRNGHFAVNLLAVDNMRTARLLPEQIHLADRHVEVVVFAYLDKAEAARLVVLIFHYLARDLSTLLRNSVKEARRKIVRQRL